MFSDMRGDSVNLGDGTKPGDLYYKKDGKLVYRENDQAFEANASTEEGRKWIVDRAQPGFKLQGEIYKDLNINVEKEGILSQKGVDYSYSIVGVNEPKLGDVTTAQIVDGRLKVNIALFERHKDNLYNKNFYKVVFDNLSTFLHETFFHGDNFEKSFLSKNYNFKVGTNFLDAFGHRHYKNRNSVTDSYIKTSLFGTTAFKILQTVNDDYKLNLNEYNIIHDFMGRGMKYEYKDFYPLIKK